MSDLLRNLLLVREDKKMETRTTMGEGHSDLNENENVMDNSNDSDDEDFIPTEAKDGTWSAEGTTAETVISGKKKRGKKSVPSTSIKVGKRNTSKNNDKFQGTSRGLRKRGNYAGLETEQNPLENVEMDELEAEEAEEQAETDRLWTDFLKGLEVERAKKMAGRDGVTEAISKVKANGITDSNGEPQPGPSSAIRSTTNSSMETNELSPEQRKKGGISILGNDPKAIGLDQANLDKRGLSGLLEAMQSQPGEKSGTLEKSQLDWEEYKKDEGLKAELEKHKKSNDAYLEKQEFLERVDKREFEIERNMRASTRAKRAAH